MYDKFFYLYLIYIGTLEKTTFKKKNSDFSKNVDIKSITNGRYFKGPTFYKKITLF